MGEITALEWRDVDLSKRQICVRRSESHGHVTVPKGGRERYVPLTSRLLSCLREHRHLRHARVLCSGDGTPLTPKIVSDHVRRAAKAAPTTGSGRPRPASHVLFTPSNEGSTCAVDPGVGRASESQHDRTIHAPQPRRVGSGNSATRHRSWRNIGDGCSGSCKRSEPERVRWGG